MEERMEKSSKILKNNRGYPGLLSIFVDSGNQYLMLNKQMTE